MSARNRLVPALLAAALLAGCADITLNDRSDVIAAPRLLPAWRLPPQHLRVTTREHGLHEFCVDHPL